MPKLGTATVDSPYGRFALGDAILAVRRIDSSEKERERMSHEAVLRDYFKNVEDMYRAGNATEHTYRPALKSLLEHVVPDITAVNEPKRVACGAPDYAITRAERSGPRTIGYVEAKDIGVSLDEALRTDQLKRYLDSLDNLILTDYCEFRWFVRHDNKMGLQRKVRIATIGPGRKLTWDGDGAMRVADTLVAMLTQKAPKVTSPKELAERMAHMAYMIRDVALETLRNEGLPSMGARKELLDLHEAFKTTLLPDLKESEFADMFAQTLAYGLFAARYNHTSSKPFTRHDAAREIPRSNPFLRRLFGTIEQPDLDDAPYIGFVDDLAQLLAETDMDAVLRDFGKRTRTEDPIVHFYETFLAAFNPKLRELRGVYYTPEPVVSYIVRSVDALLKSEFGLYDGLADTSKTTYARLGEQGERQLLSSSRVQILDPACGTGTFLYFVIDLIRSRFRNTNNAGAWEAYVANDLLPRIFGFELLMAPYAVAHLKLSMQLAALDMPENERADWQYSSAAGQRLNVFLTNTLEEAKAHSEVLMGRFISEEANAAAQIKRDLPVMVVLGNPPYSNYGMMNAGDWIVGQLEEYKKGLQEKKLNLREDSIKFVRFGQWRIDQTGAGILAFITSNTYIDGITHRRMRESLRETFSDIYVLDLHGSVTKHEKTPDGRSDDNVFDIQQGVAISVFVKRPNHTGLAKVHHAELWGSREEKYTTLLQTDVTTTNWSDVTSVDNESCLGRFHFFTPKAFNNIDEYCEGWSLTDIFHLKQNGVKTDRDELFFDVDRDALLARMKTFYSEQGLSPDFRQQYRVENSSSYDLLNRRHKTAFQESNIQRCLYRPFDKRWFYYSPKLTSRPAWDVMRHMLPGTNLAFSASRMVYGAPWRDILAVDSMVEFGIMAARPGNSAPLFPLYLYPGTPQLSGLISTSGESSERYPNLTATFIDTFTARLGLSWLPDGKGDRQLTIGPEDVFAYIYAVLYSPTYRHRYDELLKIDFPRVPLIHNQALFRDLCSFGDRLIGNHLMQRPLSSKVSYPVRGSNRVEALRYCAPDLAQGRAGRVYINSDQYFEGVTPEVWEFYIGGYQVADKWLKDRKGDTLTYGDIAHYGKIIAVLADTINLMEQIDEVIEDHGGWPLDAGGTSAARA